MTGRKRTPEAELGFDATAHYRHCPNEDTLAGGVIDRTHRESQSRPTATLSTPRTYTNIVKSYRG